MRKQRGILWDIVLLLFLGAALIGGGLYVGGERNTRAINRFHITVKDSSRIGFITPEMIRSRLESDSLGRYVGTVADTDVRALENYFDSMEYVKEVQIYKDLEGILWVNIEQCEPVVRISTGTGRNIYIDENGRVLPLCGYFIADVPLVTLSDSLYESKIAVKEIDKNIYKNYIFIDNLLNFVKWVGDDAFWNSQIAQINLNDKGEIELIPRVGAHVVILCEENDLGDFEKYLRKLKVFYLKELKSVGWNRYKVIDLKFDDMAVCR